MTTQTEALIARVNANHAASQAAARAGLQWTNADWGHSTAPCHCGGSYYGKRDIGVICYDCDAIAATPRDLQRGTFSDSATLRRTLITARERVAGRS